MTTSASGGQSESPTRYVDSILEQGSAWGLVTFDLECPDCRQNLRGLPKHEHPTTYMVMVRCPECGKLVHAGPGGTPMTGSEAMVSRPASSVFRAVFWGAFAGTVVAAAALVLTLFVFGLVVV